MRVVTTIHEMQQIRQQQIGSHTIGFVPTMGYLHEGHLSLIHTARVENDILIASIFVNPTQFAANEDLDHYPRNLERDLHMLETCGVNIVFTPTSQEIYPPGYATYIDIPGPLTQEAEGAFRPSHFRGVATVVLKLFHIVQPHWAYFGQKDAQQVAVLSRIVTDLNLTVSLRIIPTVREADGLAMSSRNAYLDPKSRTAATVLYRALQAGQQMFETHLRDDSTSIGQIAQAMTDVVMVEALAHLQYADIRDPISFLQLEVLHAPALLVIAAQVGPARLIDNFRLHNDGHWDKGILLER